MGAGARAILFDFDGTLARTMEDNLNAWRAAVSPHGLDIGPEDYYPLEGLQVTEVAKRFCARLPAGAAEPEELVRRKEEHYLAHHRFILYPGVEPLLARLREHRILIGVVTAGLLDRLQQSAPPGFLEQFDAIVTGEDTADGKPSPVPYLRGAQKLGVRPQECIVVENAPLGIASAKRAGAYCIALCTTLPQDALAGADEIVGSFEDLAGCDAIKRLLA